jgi:hypothetical protein
LIRIWNEEIKVIIDEKKQEYKNIYRAEMWMTTVVIRNCEQKSGNYQEP